MMRHTFCVCGILRPIILSAIVGVACGSAIAQQNVVWQEAVNRAAQRAPNARIVVLNLANRRVLASHRFSEAARTLATPGSTLKPLVLYSLIASGRWNPERRIACNRRLVVAGHSLRCPHPAAPPFDAREAITWSCNTYFAAVARTLSPGELVQILRSTGLLDITGLAPREAVTEFRPPRTPSEAQLALLGVVGIRVSPLELASAYRWLALQMAAHPASPATQIVLSGLRDSSSFGMAAEANQGGIRVAGKTGTAEDVDSARTHGWFIGLVSAAKPRVVIVVFRPQGRGADAAHLAGEIVAEAAKAERR